MPFFFLRVCRIRTSAKTCLTNNTGTAHFFPADTGPGLFTFTGTGPTDTGISLSRTGVAYTAGDFDHLTVAFLLGNYRAR